MLLELHVRDFVLIERASLELGPGLTVISGATGDGKTLLLRALRFLLGERATPERIVRRDGPATPADVAAHRDAPARQDAPAVTAESVRTAVVEGLFRVDDPTVRAELRERGAPDDWDDPDLVVSRTLDTTGKSRIKIGGRLATISELRAVSERLVDVLSQHEYQSLSRRDRQRDLLDRLGGSAEKVHQFAARRAKLRETAAQRDALAAQSADDAARDVERRELLRSLQALDPREGELDELERERDLLLHLDDVRLAIEGSHDRLVEREDAALDLLRRSIRDLAAHSERSSGLAALVQTLEGAATELASAGNALIRERDRLEADPARLASVEQRIDAYRDLARRSPLARGARLDPRDLPARFRELQASVDATDDPEERLRALDADLDAGIRQLETLGATISRERAAASRKLEQAVRTTLVELAMPDARLSVHAEHVGRGSGGPAPGRVAELAARFPSPAGLDDVELRFAGTPGQPLLPLQAVASGGELARVCLALKRALAEVDDTPLLVFDEVDQNVGGRLGAAIGRTLVAISSSRQVIAVTHLPSVAAFATHHFTVAKTVVKASGTACGRTSVRSLASQSEREHELALMIRGEPVSDTALEQARELLRLAATGTGSGRPRAKRTLASRRAPRSDRGPSRGRRASQASR